MQKKTFNMTSQILFKNIGSVFEKLLNRLYSSALKIKNLPISFFFLYEKLFHLAKKTLEPHVFISIFIKGEHLYLQQSYNNSTDKL